MKRTRYTENQIIKAIKEQESVRTLSEVCRQLGISQATFYKWKKKYSGMDGNQLKRLKELEAENSLLKRMYEI